MSWRKTNIHGQTFCNVCKLWRTHYNLVNPKVPILWLMLNWNRNWKFGCFKTLIFLDVLWPNPACFCHKYRKLCSSLGKVSSTKGMFVADRERRTWQTEKVSVLWRAFASLPLFFLADHRSQATEEITSIQIAALRIHTHQKLQASCMLISRFVAREAIKFAERTVGWCRTSHDDATWSCLLKLSASLLNLSSQTHKATKQYIESDFSMYQHLCSPTLDFRGLTSLCFLSLCSLKRKLNANEIPVAK